MLFGPHSRNFFLLVLLPIVKHSLLAVGELRLAAECTATFILLKPSDEVMSRNRDYYSKQIGISTDDFTPRKVLFLDINSCVRRLA